MPTPRVSIPQAAPSASALAAGAVLNMSADAGVANRVQAVIQQIRPAVQADGGDVEFVDITDDGTARVRFKGACIGCPSSNLTLHMGIERAVRSTVPEISRVIAVN